MNAQASVSMESALLLRLLAALAARAHGALGRNDAGERQRSIAAFAVAAYDGDEVYKLRGFVGYQIDLEFESGETFVGLGAGDMEGLSFVGQENHLFLKPKAAKVATNLTVLTTRRHYHFDYSGRGATTEAMTTSSIHCDSPMHRRRPSAMPRPRRSSWTRSSTMHRAIGRRTSTTGIAASPP